MKLVRYGAVGAEKPGLVDGDGTLRDLSGHVADIAGKVLDPASEVPANRDAVRSGQKTHSQVIRENGDDPDTFFAEMAEDLKRLDELGIVLDSDPRRVTQAGNAVQIPNADQRNPAK